MPGWGVSWALAALRLRPQEARRRDRIFDFMGIGMARISGQGGLKGWLLELHRQGDGLHLGGLDDVFGSIAGIDPPMALHGAHLHLALGIVRGDEVDALVLHAHPLASGAHGHDRV